MLNRYIFSKLLALSVGLFCIYLAYNFNSTNLYSISGNAYGTTWSVSSTEFIADHHEKKILAIIDDVDNTASNYKSDSEIAIINNSPIKTELVISNDLYSILDEAKLTSNIFKSFYDITLGKVSSSLGFSPTFNIDVSNNPNVRTYILNKSNQTVLKSSNFWFDLSSIAKGYAVQKIHEYLISNNLPNHLIDIGGEVIINGFNYKEPWMVGIQDPSSYSNKSIYVISNINGEMLSIATSGEYRNFKISPDGTKQTHTINPNNQKSIISNVLSVTVLDSKSATQADAYATGFNAMGGEESINLANKQGIPVMLINSKNDEIELLFSDKWYDFVYE